MGDAPPYRTADDEAVRAGGWRFVSAGEETPLADWIPTWDISQTFSARRRLDIDPALLREQTGLPDDARLALSVTCMSDFDDEVWRHELNAADDGTESAEIAFDTPAALLGGAATLQTSLVLSAALAPAGEPIAWRRGSVLWQDRRKVRLYGDSSRFPLIVVDFSEFGFEPSAPWFVEVGSHLDLPAMGAIVLYLNEKFPHVTEAAQHHAPDRDDLKVIRSALYADVGRVLIETALGHDDLEDDWPEESLGDVLSTLVESRFNEDIEDLRHLRDQDPSAWAAQVEARFGLLRQPLR